MSSPHCAGSQQKNWWVILCLFLRRHHQSPEINSLIEKKFTCTSSCHRFIEWGCSCQSHQQLFYSVHIPPRLNFQWEPYVILLYISAQLYTIQIFYRKNKFGITFHIKLLSLWTFFDSAKCSWCSWCLLSPDTFDSLLSAPLCSLFFWEKVKNIYCLWFWKPVPSPCLCFQMKVTTKVENFSLK